MAAKLAVFLALAVVAAQGQSVTEVWIPDETSTHLTNPLIGKTIGIPKAFFDVQVSCHIIFPNGATFELSPNNNLVHDQISGLYAVEPFNGCAVGFRNAPPSLSGTYELLSLVSHTLDNTRTLTRQRFHLTFIESDSWVVPSEE